MLLIILEQNVCELETFVEQSKIFDFEKSNFKQFTKFKIHECLLDTFEICISRTCLKFSYIFHMTFSLQSAIDFINNNNF